MNGLTPRELQVARLIRDRNATYDEIGELLGISPRTAKAHTDKIRAKLGVSKKRHIAKMMRDLGIQ